MEKTYLFPFYSFNMFVIKLKIKSKINQDLKELYPRLESIQICKPKYITNDMLNNLPDIKYLTIGEQYGYVYTCNFLLDKLPKTLLELKLYCKFNNKISNLPHKLNKLIIDGNGNYDDLYFNTELFITQIKNKSKNEYFNQYIDLLPESLTYLDINSPDFDNKVDDLPSGLLFFSLYSFVFNNKVNCLPGNLKTLKLVCPPFNQELNKLPNSLTYLQLYLNYNNKICNIPDSLLNIMYVKAFKYNDIGYYVKNKYKLNTNCKKLKVYTLYAYNSRYKYNNYSDKYYNEYYNKINKPITEFKSDIEEYYNIISNKVINYKTILCEHNNDIIYIKKFNYDKKDNMFKKYKSYNYDDL